MLQQRDTGEVTSTLSYKIISPSGETQYLSKYCFDRLMLEYGYIYRVKNGELLVFDSDGKLLDLKVEEGWNARIDTTQIILQ